MKRLTTYILAFIAIWATWLLLCPYYLRLLEGFDFYTALPDFWNLNLDIEESVFRGISGYMLQFYAYPAAGAAIHAFLSILMVLSVDLTVRKIFKDSDNLIWIAFAFLPLITHQLIKDISLVPALKCLAISLSVTAAAYLLSFRVKPFIPMPGFLKNIWSASVIMVIILGISGYMVYDKLVKSGSEELAYMDYLVEEKNWDKILEEIQPQYAQQNGTIRKYALLALSQKGILTDKAFAYGLSSSNDFLFHKTDQAILRNFNMKFYSCLGMHNTTIHYAFQQATQFHLSMNFNAARSLADTYLELKDYTLAKKHIEILSHSSCHSRWVEERMEKLESIKGCTPEYSEINQKHMWGKMIPDMYFMTERYPEDKRYREYLLCSLLADRKVGKFYEAFQKTYHEGEPVPFLYQEALLTIIGRQPEELRKYDISPDIFMAFRDFEQLAFTGKRTNAKRKYAGTYWAYLL